MTKKGNLIVIDGSDGSGKTTQSQLLFERFKKEGLPVETLKFPQYTDNLIGKLIGECLAGEHGDFLHSDPYIASVLYASDRFESKSKIERWLAEGKNIVLDRYVSANQIHQGGKIADEGKRADFLSWLDKLEYGVFGLPRPDLTIYIHLQTELSISLLKERHKTEKNSQYLTNGKVDTVELDVAYLEHAQLAAAWLMKENAGWQKIECAPEGIIRERADIHEEVWEVVRPMLSRYHS